MICAQSCLYELSRRCNCKLCDYLLRKKKRINSRINCLKYNSQQPQTKKLKELEESKRDIELKIRDSIKDEKLEEEARIVERVKENPKAFYSYAKRTCKTKDPIGPLTDRDGVLTNDPVKMANLLQDQYAKAFSTPLETIDDFSGTENPNTASISDIDFSADDIISAIDEISQNSASGPDKFPAAILKQCKNELAAPLQHLWRMSLDHSKIPEEHLQQVITPIFKKGNRSLPENYRPVSLTSHIIKVFERVLRNKIVDHIESNNLIVDQQHGFRKNRNCLTQLLSHVEAIITALENNANADVIYLDFSKAFDKVDHKLLLHKLSKMGIKGKLLSWISKFLSNRTQVVLVKGKKSRPILVISGVPQGTVLGPLLFIIFINDITNATRNCQIKIFADDSKLLHAIKSIEDHDNLQNDLNAVLEWSKKNNMELNHKKFELLHHGYHEHLKSKYDLPNNLHISSDSSSVRDLGIQVSDTLAWRDHYTVMITEAKKYAGWILRTFSSRSLSVILPLYISFVRSRLENCCPLWFPFTKKDIMSLEAIQRSFTAKINSLYDLNYWDRLKKLRLYSLQRRRERFCIIQVWKILHKISPNDTLVSFHDNARLGPVADIPRLISRRQHTNTLRDQSFSCNGPRLFNILPKELKELDSLPTFKVQLDRFLKLFPDTPPTPGYVAVNANSLLDWVACGSSKYGGYTGSVAASLVMA